jgi:hypothetical protein
MLSHVTCDIITEDIAVGKLERERRASLDEVVAVYTRVVNVMHQARDHYREYLVSLQKAMDLVCYNYHVGTVCHGPRMAPVVE